ncbi:MAG TPA: aspartyl/asparaginyl beta-hydroxylase domain-containing protein [Lacipirellulaceae bacterium]|jgi:beta-hydroxylase
MSTISAARPKSSPLVKFTKKTIKRTIPPLVALYFIPKLFLAFIACGLADVLRNRPFELSRFTRYFAGKGVLTWMLSPFNLLLDLVSLPYWNKGIYRMNDLPARYQAEIQTLVDACHKRDLISALESKMGEKKRGMYFFQWYGKLLPASIEIPEFQQRFKYIRTIGVSIFNKKQSTDKHFGPLRVTYRVLYNINPVNDPNVFIKVGEHTHRWRDEQLFIFDDTLEHESHNESDAVRYCLFVDILRPSLVPWLLSGIVTSIRLVMAPVRRIFYAHWTMIK